MITEPLLSNPKGGITALLFIIANEALERLASFGLSTNMIMYLTREYGMDAASGAQILFLYSAAGNFMPIIGAFLADTYVGRYPMIGFGCITSLLGMVLLWLTTIIPEARVPSCAQFSSTCNNEATTPQLLFLYFCLALMSIGAGGIRSCSLAFGADQLRKRDSLKYAGILESFFSWYYVISSASVFISMTCLVYIQDALGWKVGFGVPVVLMILSTLSFFLASPIYVKPKAKANWLVGFARVLVASFRKRRIGLCSQNPDELYHHRKGSALVVPSERIRSGNYREGATRNRNRGKGFRDNPDAATHMSAMWLLPFYFLLGFSEAMNGVGRNEFFYIELPKSMSSVASNLFKYWTVSRKLGSQLLYKAYGPCKGGQGGIAGDVREGSADDDDDVDDDYSSLS
ncbi:OLIGOPEPTIDE TRANSPORTER-RELATED [Salix viminalis]|uniref:OLIGOPEPTIDE TRANSPORTER-RELATED n=1 Tax=Salix viminalis TaxID=40686 RepID=A0A9Q0NQJ7_SALVM|nr:OLIGOPEPTIDE TRANSPORTER-RELATED [Salix viminalis]